MLTPLRDGILFIFLDEASSAGFREKTNWGFQLLTNSDRTNGDPRWGKVVALGEDLKDNEDVKNGSFVLIEPLMWTLGMTYDGTKVWKTDISKILAVSDELPKL